MRKSDYWYSRNKVLGLSHVTGRKPHARNPNFDTEETKLLISLWGDPKIQKTLITTHKKSPVIEKLAQTMRERGYFRSPEEINTRIKNLKCIYNRIKKDLDMGILTETTWKHYDAMEEILNRPIFGRDAAQERVRQQEMQLKRELEKANNDKAQQISSESLVFLKDFMDDNGDSDDDDEFGDDEADMDEDDQSDYVPIEMTEDDSSIDDTPMVKVTQNVTKNNSENAKPIEIKTEESLVVPKEEPIDVDDADIPAPKKTPEPQNKIKITAISSEQLATISNNTTINKITINPSQAQNAIKFSQASSFVMSTPTTANSPQAGKISLVPTNILLKPQSQQSTTNLTFKPQQFIYTKAPNQTGTIQTNMSVPMSSATVTSNTGMPMKLLLVNRVPQNMNQAKDAIHTTQTIIQTQATTHTMPTATQTQVITTPATIKSITPAQQAIPTQTRLKMPEGERKPQPPPSSHTWKSTKCSLPGFRTLLHQIAQVEQQNLEINRQRLEMEKQRFEFEKSMAEKFLAILPNIQFVNNSSNNNNNSTANNSNNPNSYQPNDSGHSNGETISNGCMSPKKEIEDEDE